MGMAKVMPIFYE